MDFTGTAPSMTTESLSESAIIDEIRALRAQQSSIQARLRQLTVQLSNHRIPLLCLRCGWQWVQNDPTVLPLCCARCGSAGWNRPPGTPRARRPDDPPRKTWRKRRRNHPESSPHAAAFPIAAVTPLPPLPSEATRTLSVIKETVELITAPPTGVPSSAPMSTPIVIPPSVRAAIPPPPSPRAAPSLSEQFRAITTPQEEQPERVATHAQEEFDGRENPLHSLREEVHNPVDVPIVRPSDELAANDATLPDVQGTEPQAEAPPSLASQEPTDE